MAGQSNNNTTNTTNTTNNHKRKVEDLETTQIVDEVAAAAAAEPDDFDDEGSKDEGSKGTRRFFPRVKHLLTPDFEPFLIGLLDTLDDTEAPKAAAASHKETNEWYKAFHAVYAGVGRDCSQPQGKNRYHKFKDKIVELWTAIEAYTGGDLPLRGRALEQLDEHRRACQSHPTMKREPRASAAMALKVAASYRPKPGVKPPTHTRWENLDEKAALASLPEDLQHLVHCRNLATELGISGRAAIEEQYDKVLTQFLQSTPQGADALYAKCIGLALLARYCHTHKEKKEISEVFERVITEYLAATSGVTIATV